jgi:hypothetical protein
MEKKFFTLKEYKNTHIGDDNQDYDYIEGDDLLSHFFNMKFESDTGEIIFLVCHLYTRWENGCGQCAEYKFFFTDNLASEENFDVDFSLINSNNQYEIEEIISEEMLPADATDEGWDLDDFIGETFDI